MYFANLNAKNKHCRCRKYAWHIFSKPIHNNFKCAFLPGGVENFASLRDIEVIRGEERIIRSL